VTQKKTEKERKNTTRPRKRDNLQKRVGKGVFEEPKDMMARKPGLL
jgi:hypothetical protein